MLFRGYKQYTVKSLVLPNAITIQAGVQLYFTASHNLQKPLSSPMVTGIYGLTVLLRVDGAIPTFNKIKERRGEKGIAYMQVIFFFT